jgi:hypothetical protein
LSLKPNAPTNYVTQTGEIQQKTIQPIAKNQLSPPAQTPPLLPEEKNTETIKNVQNKTEYRAVKTAYVKPEKVLTSAKSGDTKSDAPVPVVRENSGNILGEESYIKTIATLNTTVANRKDEVLSPSMRYAFERDLAVTDDAITKMKLEVRRNPKNEAAKQILRASYQNKIDLLNSVANKTELMASLD